MKTLVIIDITAAISRPTYRSRTIASDTMREPAAPSPAIVRPRSIAQNEVAKTHNDVPADNRELGERDGRRNGVAAGGEIGEIGGDDSRADREGEPAVRATA